jgi:hypothetical protein
VWRVKNASAETPPTAAAAKTSAAAAAVAPPPPRPPDSAAVPARAFTAAAVSSRREFFASPPAAPALVPAVAPAAAPVTRSVTPGALAYMRTRDDGPAVASTVLDAYAFPDGDVGRPGNVPSGKKRSNEAYNTPGNDVVAKLSKRTTTTTTSKTADVARARGAHNGEPSETSQQVQWAWSLRSPTSAHDSPVVRSSMHAGSERPPTHSLGWCVQLRSGAHAGRRHSCAGRAVLARRGGVTRRRASWGMAAVSTFFSTYLPPRPVRHSRQATSQPDRTALRRDHSCTERATGERGE